MARIRKGDRVVVTRGNDRGKQGKVLRVLPDRDLVVVEGVRVVKKHRSAKQGQAGGILEEEAPLHLSAVMPVDPGTGKPTRVRYVVKDGKKVRIARSGAEIVGER